MRKESSIVVCLSQSSFKPVRATDVHAWLGPGSAGSEAGTHSTELLIPPSLLLQARAYHVKGHDHATTRTDTPQLGDITLYDRGPPAPHHTHG
jgi:hypothetical protein